ncbi:MAG: acetoin utilization protein AcuC, partial [Actinomycetota bacterium]
TKAPAVTTRVAITSDDTLVSYQIGPQQTLKPIRLNLTIELARADGILDLARVDVVKPHQASREELELVHTPRYIDAVEQISATATDPFGTYGWGIGIGDNPAFRGMHEASALVAGASLVAAERITSAQAEHAFNPAGGLHHAMPDRASGFCIYDDPAIAIRRLLDLGERVVYIDVDVHHGDGPQFIFYDEPNVMTISLHESGEYLFPGTGFPEEIGAGAAEGTKVNVALPPLTDDDAYRAAFERVVPPLVESFKPTILVTQLGCDTHATDPLAHLALVTGTYRWIAKTLHDLAHHTTHGRWLALGGGGYQIYTVVPRAWTIYAAEITGAELDDELPDAWRKLAMEHGAPPELPRTLSDPPVRAPRGRLEQAREEAKVAAERTAAAVFGHHGIA